MIDIIKLFPCENLVRGLLKPRESHQFGVDSPLDGVSGFEDQDTEDDDGDDLSCTRPFTEK